MDEKRMRREESGEEDLDEDREGFVNEKKKRKKKKRKKDGTNTDVDDTSNKTKKRKVRYSSAKWSWSSSESEYEDLFIPDLLGIANLPLDATEAEVMDFFDPKHEVVVLKDEIFEGAVVARGGLIRFNSHSEIKEALKLKGKELREYPMYIARQGNSRDIVRVSGFPNQLGAKNIKRQLREIFQKRGEVLNIFLPKNSKTGSCLGFGYIYLDSDDSGLSRVQPSEKLYASAEISGVPIDIRAATPKRCFQAEMLGQKTVLKMESDEDKKTALKKTLLPLQTLMDRSRNTFSWTKKRPDITAEPYKQPEHDCWAVGLSRGYTALRKILEIPAPTPDLSPGRVLRGVDPVYQITGEGIDNIKNAAPFLSSYVEQMIVHRRPRGDDVAAYEGFEKFVIELLKVSPVMVTIECLPSYMEFSGPLNGQGIYRPTDLDCYLRTFEKLPIHCPLLTGYDVREGIEVWEVHQSYGIDHGYDGFIWMERHKCLIKSVVQFKLSVRAV